MPDPALILKQVVRSDTGKSRLPPADDSPLVLTGWYRVLFLHFEVETAVVRDQLPPSFELELHHGKAIVSLVALTSAPIRALHGGRDYSLRLPNSVSSTFALTSDTMTSRVRFSFGAGCRDLGDCRCPAGRSA